VFILTAVGEVSTLGTKAPQSFARIIAGRKTLCYPEEPLGNVGAEEIRTPRCAWLDGRGGRPHIFGLPGLLIKLHQGFDCCVVKFGAELFYGLIGAVGPGAIG
jgi:hypothetical protein